jgi:hypothetical protein
MVPFPLLGMNDCTVLFMTSPSPGYAVAPGMIDVTKNAKKVSECILNIVAEKTSKMKE